MFKLLVTLQIRDFQALEEFECNASKIMADYQGKIVFAFETIRNEDGTGEEVHIIEFPREVNFNNYRSDPRLQDLRGLREKAISSTEIKMRINEKSYSQ